jgi:hypothetical protein
MSRFFPLHAAHLLGTPPPSPKGSTGSPLHPTSEPASAERQSAECETLHRAFRGQRGALVEQRRPHLAGRSVPERLAAPEPVPDDPESGKGPLRFSLAGVELKFSALHEASGGLTIPPSGAGGS